MAKYFTREEAEKLAAEIIETYGLYARVSDVKHTGNPSLNYSFIGIFLTADRDRCVSACDTQEQFEDLKRIAHIIAVVDADIQSIEHHEKDGLIEEFFVEEEPRRKRGAESLRDIELAMGLNELPKEDKSIPVTNKERKQWEASKQPDFDYHAIIFQRDNLDLT